MQDYLGGVKMVKRITQETLDKYQGRERENSGKLIVLARTLTNPLAIHYEENKEEWDPKKFIRINLKVYPKKISGNLDYLTEWVEKGVPYDIAGNAGGSGFYDATREKITNTIKVSGVDIRDAYFLARKTGFDLGRFVREVSKEAKKFKKNKNGRQ